MPRMLRAGVRPTASRDSTRRGDRVLAVSRLSRRVASPSRGLLGAADRVERAPLDRAVGSASTKLAFLYRATLATPSGGAQIAGRRWCRSQSAALPAHCSPRCKKMASTGANEAASRSSYDEQINGDTGVSNADRARRREDAQPTSDAYRTAPNPPEPRNV